MSETDYSDLSRDELIAELRMARRNRSSSRPSGTPESTRDHYRALVEGSSDFIYILDKEGLFTFASHEIERLLGYRPDQIVGKHYSEILDARDLDTFRRSFHESRAGGHAPHRLEVRFHTRTGAIRNVEIELRHFALGASGPHDGDFHGTHGVARQVTERRDRDARHQGLQQLREQVWTMVDYGDLKHVVESIGRVLEAVGIPFHHCSITLLDMSEPPILRTYSSTGAPGICKQGEWMVADTDRFTASIAEIWRHDETAHRTDLDAEDRFDERNSIRDRYGPVRSVVDVPFSRGTLSVSSTEPAAFPDEDIGFLQKLAEALAEGFRRIEAVEQMAESVSRYRTLVETPNFVVMLLDAAGNFLYVSPQIETWLGYTAEEFYQEADLSRQLIHPEDLDATTPFHQIEPGSTLSQVEYRWRRKSGEYRWASSSIFPVYGDPADAPIKRVSMVEVVVQDITERKIGEERIRAQLAEKEVLLQEIHHRVKNNLQIISSLLQLQSRQLEDEDLLAIFNDSQHRVRSMGLIHEQLYKSVDLARIDFAGYMSSLTENLMQSYGIDESRIELRANARNIYFEIDTAVPLGLIVNELVSNALKHAFPGDRAGAIELSVASDAEGGFQLSVTDNGVGMPADLDWENSTSLGLKLVSTLAAQLRSQVTVNRDSGTRFAIERTVESSPAAAGAPASG